VTKHFQIDCGREVGYPFVQAFLFLPQGSTLYVGDLGAIREKTNDLPTCHGVVLFWQFKQVQMKRIMLFGKHTGHGGGFVLLHGNNTRGGKNAVSTAVRIFASSRPQYILLYNDGSKYELVNRWRRMPSCYLGDVFEKYLNYREQRKKTVAEQLMSSKKKTFTLPKVKEETENMMKQWMESVNTSYVSNEIMSKMDDDVFRQTTLELDKMLEEEYDGHP